MRFLDFIRKQHSQLRQALQPAPAEIEEAILAKDQDIKALLHKEIATAQQSGRGPWPRLMQANLEASHAFKPILEAMQQLAQEVAENKDIRCTIHDNEVELTIGQERRVRASRYGWQRDFTVEDHILWSEVGEYIARTYAFKTSEDVIIFIVRACAEFLARQP